MSKRRSKKKMRHCQACLEEIRHGSTHCKECSDELLHGKIFVPPELRFPHRRISPLLQTQASSLYKDAHQMVREANTTWCWRAKFHSISNNVLATDGTVERSC